MGSPALSMIRGCQPARRSPFSREFSAVFEPEKAVFIKSAGEPLNGAIILVVFVALRGSIGECAHNSVAVTL